MILTDALQLVPEYILLRPGVDKWREGDEYLSYDQVFKRIGVDFTKFGELVDAFTLYRRPIPQHVREAMAWWILFNVLAEIPPHGANGAILELTRGITDFDNIGICIHQVRGLFYGHSRRFKTKEDAEDAIEVLGGQNRIIRELEKGPDPFGRWLSGGEV